MKKLNLRAYIPSFLPGGRKGILKGSELKSDISCSTNRSYAGFNSYFHSSSMSRIHHGGNWEKFHKKTASGSLYQIFSRDRIQGVENRNSSLSNSSSGDKDELASSVAEGNDASLELVPGEHKASLITESSTKLLQNETKWHGETSNTPTQRGQYIQKNEHTQVEGIKSDKRALATQGTAVKGHNQLAPSQIPQLVAIRVSNINIVTTKPTIYSICVRYGSVGRLARRSGGIVDVLYNIKDNPIALVHSIVKKLNDVTIDDCRWSARFIRPKEKKKTKDAKTRKRQCR